MGKLKIKKGAKLLLDLGPMTVKEFGEHDASEADRMLSRITELGFELTDEERQSWVDWFDECDDDSGEMKD